MKKRLLSLLLVLALALAILPQTALAAEPACAHEHTAPLDETYGVTRGDMCYLLWKLDGCPEPTLQNAFEDLSETDDCYKAVLWAQEKKIIVGVSETQFAPDMEITRGQAVTYLWRYAGMPQGTQTDVPYVDASWGAYYYAALRWAPDAEWLDLDADGEYFQPSVIVGAIRLEGTVCEDCGKILSTSKLTLSRTTKANGVCGDNLTWDLDDGVLTLSGSGEMRDYTQEELPPWHKYKEQIKKLVLPEGLTDIGALAFYDLALLQELTIPESVTSIGGFAFYGCSSLTRLTVPGNVEIIGDSAFQACDGLLQATISEGVEIIGNQAFVACHFLEDVTIPKSVTYIGYEAFLDTGYAIDDANWSGELLYLGDWVIESKRSIETIQIRPGTRGIAGAAFWECNFARSITIPEGVTVIGDWAFCGCGMQTVTIPDTVTSIGAFTFCGCVDLERIELPESVEIIDAYAFVDCTSLTSITVKNKECTIVPGGEYPDWTMGDPEFITIYGYAGSTAEAYAREYGYRFTALSEKVPFLDVPSNAFYEDPVAWAVGNEITNGLDESHFGPDKACTRGQVVTFLWRAAGCPEPENAATAFTDMKAGAFYEKAVAWAVEQGITNGMSANSFAPDATCTRGQIVTFLWRFREKTEPKSTKTDFTDVPESAFYAKAVAWAVENGITNGMTPTTFAPDTICTRGQVVTFLYRATAEK